MPRTLQEDPVRGRDVHLYDDNGTLLGGLILKNQQYITRRNFYDLCHIFVRSSSQWVLFHLQNDGSTGHILQSNDNVLLAGSYVVLHANRQSIAADVTTEVAPRRVTTNQGSSGRLTTLQRHFRNSLRRRDNACVISGYSGNPNDPYLNLDAVHIYPVARASGWTQNNYQQWITDNAPASQIGPTRLYSPQNGLLLNKLLHSEFVNFEISVNPDDGYKIVSFIGNASGVGGNILGHTATNPGDLNQRVSDDALRWHFRQAVLANMKAAGQMSWEHDFGGPDEMTEILESSDAAERMEVELFTRLDSSQYHPDDEMDDS